MINNSDYKEYKAMMMALSNIPGNRGNYTFEDFKKQKADTELRQKLTPEIKENINKGDLEKAYKSYEQLPFGDMLSYEMSPGLGDAISGYEIAEFSRRGEKAKEEGRYLDAAGNYLISGLNTAGTAATLIPPLNYGLDAVDAAVKGVGKYLRSKGTSSIPTPPIKTAPTPKGLEHKILHTADRPKEVKNLEKWNSDLAEETNYRSSAKLMPLRYGDNDTQMTSQLALFESDLYTPKNRNKLFPIENILQSMRRYGVTGKGNVNQNVNRQIEDFISPEFMAKGKASPADVMEELQKNAPKIQETHAYYNLNSLMESNKGYSNFTTRRPLYDLDSPTTTVGDSPEQTSRTYGERVFNMYDDGRIYGKKPSLEEPSPKVSFVNTNHEDLALGKKIPQIEAPTTNKYMHSRYTIEDIDGDANVYVKQEAQSDAYGLTKDQNKLAASVGAEDTPGGRMDVQHIMYRIGDEEVGITFDDILKGKHTAGDALEAADDTRDFHKFLKETGELDNFNKEFDEIAKKFETERENAIAAGNFEIINMRNSQNPLMEPYVAEAADAYNQRGERLISNYMKDFSEYLGIAKDPINLPRSADWFTDGFKLDLQTAVKNDSPYALFPNGARSLAPPSGVTTIIPPKMVPFIIKKYKDKKGVRLDYDDDGKFLGVSENQDGRFTRVLDAEPDPSSINRAKSYNDFYKKAIKQTEQDYGVKLNPTEYTDQYGQEYLKIILSPELKSSFQTFRMKHGGVASLMPLNYGL